MSNHSAMLPDTFHLVALLEQKLHHTLQRNQKVAEKIRNYHGDGDCCGVLGSSKRRQSPVGLHSIIAHRNRGISQNML